MSSRASRSPCPSVSTSASASSSRSSGRWPADDLGQLPHTSRSPDRCEHDLFGGRPVMDDRPCYMISVAAELVGMHPQTLRIYEQKGLVRPGRTPGGTRLYSERDLDRLRLIQRLTTELGLNLAGVERVIALEDEIGKLRGRIARLERQMREEVER